MRKIPARFAIVLLVAAPLIAAAAPRDESGGAFRTGDVEFSAQVGYAWPLGDLTFVRPGTVERFDLSPRPGPVFAVQLGYYTTPHLALGATFSFSQFGEEDATPYGEGYPDSVLSAEDHDLTLTELTASLKLLLARGPGWMPYVRGMGGLVRHQVEIPQEDENIQAKNTEAKLGVGAAAGLQYRGGGSFGLLLEGNLMISLSTLGTSTAGIRAGLVFYPSAGERARNRSRISDARRSMASNRPASMSAGSKRLATKPTP